jgi:K+-sensing histidine kinase KdpD
MGIWLAANARAMISNCVPRAFVHRRAELCDAGLWNCRAIIEAPNGQLTVSPRANHGSVFQIALPVGYALGHPRT